MSLPKHPPSHSSSPSKSSLRSTSGTSTTQKPAPGRALLPSLYSEERPLAHSQAVEDEEESRLPERDGSSFQPFFTLIEDRLTHTHHHPTVHYIFADDDTDIVTEAACRSLAQDEPFSNTTGAPEQAMGGKSRKRDLEPPDADDGEQEPSKLPTPQPGVREHYLILDVQPTEHNTRTTTHSYEVTQAHSLSAEWQVTNTAISNAPSIDAVDDGGGFEGSEGLMLRIEGRGVVPSDEDNADDNGRGSREQETLEERVRRFEMGLAEIRRAIEAGGGFAGRQEEEEVLGD